MVFAAISFSLSFSLMTAIIGIPAVVAIQAIMRKLDLKIVSIIPDADKQ